MWRRDPEDHRKWLTPLRTPRFKIFFFTYSSSTLGTSMATVALSFGVLQTGGSLTDLGYVLSARIVPLVLFLLGGGVAGDRLSRRWIMLGADTVRVLGQGTTATLFALGHAPLWAIMALAAVGGLGEAFFNPALDGLIPSLAPKEQLQEANTLLGLARSVANVLGPATAGILIAISSPATVLAIDAASYLVSVIGLSLLRLPAGLVRPTASVLRQLLEGWNRFRSHTWLWAITIQFSLFNLIVWAPYLVLGPASAYIKYGGAFAWGVIMVGYGAGSIVGGIALLGRRPQRPLVVAVAATFAWVSPSACLLLSAPVSVVTVGALCAGIASAVFNGLWSTTVQQQVPPDALSRITSYVSFGAYALGPIGLAIAGPIAEATSIATVLAAGVGWQLIASATVLMLPSVRAIGQPQLNTVDGGELS